MKKNRTKYYFIAILLIHILVYFFKIDKDIFALQEYVSRPNQTYTKQPLSKNVSYFFSSNLSFPKSSKSCDAKYICINCNAVWNSNFLSYNSRVHHLLKLNESFLTPTIIFIAVLHRQNIFHKSSEDEELEQCFFA